MSAMPESRESCTLQSQTIAFLQGIGLLRLARRCRASTFSKTSSKASASSRMEKERLPSAPAGLDAEVGHDTGVQQERAFLTQERKDRGVQLLRPLLHRVDQGGDPLDKARVRPRSRESAGKCPVTLPLRFLCSRPRNAQDHEPREALARRTTWQPSPRCAPRRR